MKSEDLIDAMNELDEDIIAEADKMRVKKKHGIKLWVGGASVAAAACLCVILANVFLNAGVTTVPVQVATATTTAATTPELTTTPKLTTTSAPTVTHTTNVTTTTTAASSEVVTTTPQTDVTEAVTTTTVITTVDTTITTSTPAVTEATTEPVATAAPITATSTTERTTITTTQPVTTTHEPISPELLEELEQIRAYAAATAVYPEVVPLPNADDYVNKKTWEFDSDAYDDAYSLCNDDAKVRYAASRKIQKSSIFEFSSLSSKEILSGTTYENCVYSPLNMYMALSMLAETTDGNSRGQLLSLLGSDSIEALRKNANSLWTATYRNDGVVTNLLASSVWLSSIVDFKQETLDILSKDYYASSFVGGMGSTKFNNMLHDWLNEQTGGLLSDSAELLEFYPQTVMALATTVYFSASWQEKFYKAASTNDTFYAPTGDIICGYMNQSSQQSYYRGDNFGAIQKTLMQSGSMWLILPDNDAGVDDVLSGVQLWELLQKTYKYENTRYMQVNLSLPKFDVSSQLELNDNLKALGVTDVFIEGTADFTPLCDNCDKLNVNKVTHDARVLIDEDGCIATAYTLIDGDDTCAPYEELETIDLIFNRPFIFVITNEYGLPSFIGVVNMPA